MPCTNSFKWDRSRKRDTFIVQNLINRAMFYAMSIEFTQSNKNIIIRLFLALNVPPDFHIEHSILNVHIWLLADRLKKIGVILLKKIVIDRVLKQSL